MSALEAHELGLKLRYLVKYDGISLGIWTKVEGLNVQFDTIKYYYTSGTLKDWNQFIQVPGRPNWKNLKLTRGITAKTTKELEEFFGKFTAGGGFSSMSQISIECGTAWGEPAGKWVIENAWPVSWDGPTFDAQGKDIATETIEFVHNGWTWTPYIPKL